MAGGRDGGRGLALPLKNSMFSCWIGVSRAGLNMLLLAHFHPIHVPAEEAGSSPKPREAVGKRAASAPPPAHASVRCSIQQPGVIAGVAEQQSPTSTRVRACVCVYLESAFSVWRL